MLRLIAGILMVFLGIAYLYRPEQIIRLNAWIKEYICNDQVLINHRRKIGVVLLVVGVALFFLGIK